MKDEPSAATTTTAATTATTTSFIILRWILHQVSFACDFLDKYQNAKGTLNYLLLKLGLERIVKFDRNNPEYHSEPEVLVFDVSV